MNFIDMRVFIASVALLFGAMSPPSWAGTYNIPTIGWLERLQSWCDRTKCTKTGAPVRALHYASCSSEKDLSHATEIRKSQGFGSVYLAWGEFTLPNGQICVRTLTPSVEYLNATESQLLLSASLASEIAFTQSMQNLIPAGDETDVPDLRLEPDATPAPTVFEANISGNESKSSQILTMEEEELPYLINAKGMPLFLDDNTSFTLNVVLATSAKMSSGTVATSNIFWVDESEVILGNKPTFTIRGIDFAIGVHLIAVGSSAAGPFSGSFEFEVRQSLK